MPGPADVRHVGDVGIVHIAPVLHENITAVRDVVLLVEDIHVQRRHDGLGVRGAVDGAGLLARLRERGQQHGGEDRDDRDDDEELNEGEGLALHGVGLP